MDDDVASIIRRALGVGGGGGGGGSRPGTAGTVGAKTEYSDDDSEEDR